MGIDSLGSGSAERITTILANNLLQKEYEVSLLVLKKRDSEYLILPEVQIVYIDNYDKLKQNQWFSYFRYFSNIRKQIKGINPSAIISLSMQDTIKLF